MPTSAPARRDPSLAPRPASPVASPPGPPLTTPLTWAWGGVLLTVTVWLTGILALVQGCASLID